MILLLILAFSRDIKGDTFFHHYEHEDYEITCNTSSEHNTTDWWAGDHCSSLQKFQRVTCNGSKTSPSCIERNGEKCTSGTLTISASSSGGVFACRTWMLNNSEKVAPLFTNREHCRIFNFFIVAMIDPKEEEIIQSRSEQPGRTIRSVEEKGNLTLPCEVQVIETLVSTIFWFKEGEPATCLLSVTNEENEITSDTNCCVDPEVKDRRWYNVSCGQGAFWNCTLTIFNVSSSDSGKYICVVSTHNNKQVWKIVNNVSVEVNPLLPKSGGPDQTVPASLFISLSVIGVILLIGGIVFLCWKKHSKGKPLEGLKRQVVTSEEEDECSPYAVSGPKDIAGMMTVYSLAMNPGVDPNGGSSLATSGENGQDVYAVVNKQRS